MAVNQKQIAEQLGVSIALVSRVLSGRAAEIGIAQDTIDRVVKAALEMGYVPSAAALSLKGKATRTIGVAVYDFNDPFFGLLIREIQRQAHQHDYSLILTGFLNRVPERQDLQALHKHAIEGLIVLGSDTDAAWLEDFSDLPTARIGHGSVREKSVRISIDENDAARQLAAYLAEKGRCRLLGIVGSYAPHRLRHDALLQATAEAGVAFDSVFSTEKDPFSAGLLAVRERLKSGLGADTLVCATDQIAMGALRALTESGAMVPGEVAVTGFDDIPAAAQINPSLTTVRQPLGRMVAEAFERVVSPEKPETIVHKGFLVARETA